MDDLPIHIDQQSVPVFDCHVLITRSEETADLVLVGVVSNLPEVTAIASNERDLLRQIAKLFKEKIIEYQQSNQEIPWQETRKPGPGEQQRWLPVHL